MIHAFICFLVNKQGLKYKPVNNQVQLESIDLLIFFLLLLLFTLSGWQFLQQTGGVKTVALPSAGQLRNNVIFDFLLSKLGLVSHLTIITIMYYISMIELNSLFAHPMSMSTVQNIWGFEKESSDN